MGQLELLVRERKALEEQASGEKAESAYKTISEVSEELDVPQHVLRFWEGRFTQITPLKRKGGRRYYRPEDVTILQVIKELLYNRGYTIKGAVKALQDGDLPSEVSSVPIAREIKKLEDSATPSRHGIEAKSTLVVALPKGYAAVRRSELDALLNELYELRQLVKPLPKTA